MSLKRLTKVFLRKERKISKVHTLHICKGRTFGLLLLTVLVAEFTNPRLSYFSTRVLSQPCAF